MAGRRASSSASDRTRSRSSSPSASRPARSTSRFASSASPSATARRASSNATAPAGRTTIEILEHRFELGIGCTRDQLVDLLVDFALLRLEWTRRSHVPARALRVVAQGRSKLREILHPLDRRLGEGHAEPKRSPRVLGRQAAEVDRIEQASRGDPAIASVFELRQAQARRGLAVRAGILGQHTAEPAQAIVLTAVFEGELRKPQGRVVRHRARGIGRDERLEGLALRAARSARRLRERRFVGGALLVGHPLRRESGPGARRAPRDRDRCEPDGFARSSRHRPAPLRARRAARRQSNRSRSFSTKPFVAGETS